MLGKLFSVLQGHAFFGVGVLLKPHDCTTILMEVAQIVPKEAEDRGQGSDDCRSICRLGGRLGSRSPGSGVPGVGYFPSTRSIPSIDPNIL